MFMLSLHTYFPSLPLQNYLLPTKPSPYIELLPIVHFSNIMCLFWASRWLKVHTNVVRVFGL